MRKDWRDTFEALEEDDTQWMSSDGEIHNIQEMDIMYIWNCVKMLRRDSIKYQMEYKIPLLMFERLEILKESRPEYFL